MLCKRYVFNENALHDCYTFSKEISEYYKMGVYIRQHLIRGEWIISRGPGAQQGSAVLVYVEEKDETCQVTIGQKKSNLGDNWEQVGKGKLLLEDW